LHGYQAKTHTIGAPLEDVLCVSRLQVAKLMGAVVEMQRVWQATIPTSVEEDASVDVLIPARHERFKRTWRGRPDAMITILLAGVHRTVGVARVPAAVNGRRVRTGPCNRRPCDMIWDALRPSGRRGLGEAGRRPCSCADASLRTSFADCRRVQRQSPGTGWRHRRFACRCHHAVCARCPAPKSR